MGRMMSVRKQPSVPSRADGLVALLILGVTGAGSTDEVVAWLPHYAIAPLAVAQGLLMLARRRAPVMTLAGTTVLAVGMIAVGYPAGSATIGVLAAAFTLGLYGRRGGGAAGTDLALDGRERSRTVREAATAGIAALATVVATVTPSARSLTAPWGPASVGLLVAGAWISGYAIRTRGAYIAELKDRAARLEAEQGERAARAVADERLRIARELHDVIGHSISLISIQSEAATRSARTDPSAVPGFLATISATSREALTELRHVLAVLRPDAEADLTPQPGLPDLPDLVARIESGGTRVRLDVETMELPPGMGLAVYRIVQEALTNVLRHAGPGAAAGVTVAPSAGLLCVSVHDDGVGPSGSGPTSAHGIVGMRERVAVYGGSLTVGAGPAGGFRVEAVIPLAGTERREKR
jgi:signal transduction histidine kinase